MTARLILDATSETQLLLSADAVARLFLGESIVVAAAAFPGPGGPIAIYVGIGL